MPSPEVRIIGPEYDGAVDQLGTFRDKVEQIVIHIAGKHHGESAALSPTDVEITPVVLEDDSFFIIRAWRETGSPRGKVGILQPMEGAFDLVKDDTNAYLHHRVDSGANYKLTTVEAMTLSDLGRLAAAQDAINSPMAREIPES